MRNSKWISERRRRLKWLFTFCDGFVGDMHTVTMNRKSHNINGLSQTRRKEKKEWKEEGGALKIGKLKGVKTRETRAMCSALSKK